MKLPSEDALREYLRTELAAEFQVASELLAIGVGLFENFAIGSPDVPSFDEIGVCVGVIAKACKQYRAIVGLVELGLGDVANTNCRMLLETSLAAQFLMRDEVKLRRGKREVPEVPGYPLTTAFRTQLYLANDALNIAKTLRGLAEDGGLGTDDDEAVVKQAERFAAELCNPLGTEWTERLKKSGSFSGVKVFELAASLDRQFVYAAFYRPASQGVHAADARRATGVELEEDGRVSIRFPTKSDGVADALALASHALLDVLQIAGLRFGLGLEGRTKTLRQRVQRMRHG